jgi:hypothetical protein
MGDSDVILFRQLEYQAWEEMPPLPIVQSEGHGSNTGRKDTRVWSDCWTKIMVKLIGLIHRKQEPQF